MPASPRFVPAVASVLLLAAAACDTEASQPVTVESYVDELETICASTTAELEALPRPPELISVVDFATNASSALADEADSFRRLDVPEEMDADHRALVRNTDEQADAWTDVAEGGDSELAEPAELIGQLVAGRNDLVDEMGAAGCRRGSL